MTDIFNMNKIREEYLKNIDLYKTHPEVSRYMLGNNECIVCFKEAITPVQHLKENHQRVVVEKEKLHTADFKNLVQRMGVCIFEKITNTEIRPSSTEKNIDPIITYLNFIECTDLGTSKSSIKRFDLDVFSDLFTLDVIDQNIQRFINKLENDPMMYEKKDKCVFLDILILAYTFCNTKKINAKKLLSRICENSFLLDIKVKVIIGFQGEPSVDKMVLQIRKNTADVSEALFMNSVYLCISRDRELFQFFHKRLIDTIDALDESYTFSYLKYVFTHNTVLFSCIENTQLLKLILSFYQNMNKLDFTVEIYNTLIKKIDDESINSMISDELLKLCKNSKKHSKLSKLTEFRSLKTFDDILIFISSNKDSFDCMNIVFNDLKDISEYTSSHRTRIQILSLFINFFRNLKTEFINRFFNVLLSILIRLLAGIVDVDDELIEFNRIYWDDLSDILLSSHRISVDSEEKKKKKDTKESQTYRLALRLAELIYKIEGKAFEKGISEFKNIKEKGFRIESPV